MKKLGLFFTGSVAAFLLFSCRYPEAGKRAPAVNEISSGEKFRINLPEDHTTGYTWQLVQDYDRNVVSQLNEVWHGNTKGIDFNLQGGAAGQTTLTFVSRKFTDTSDIQHFIVKIGGN